MRAEMEAASPLSSATNRPTGPVRAGTSTEQTVPTEGPLTGRSSSLAAVETPSMSELGQRAKAASRQLATASTAAKDAALTAAADLLVDRTPEILEANAADVSRAEAGGVTPTVVDRLRLSEARVEGMAGGLRKVASLPDPVGEIVDGWTRPNGLV